MDSTVFQTDIQIGEPEKRTIEIVLATSATTILLRINPSKKLQKTTKSYKKLES